MNREESIAVIKEIFDKCRYLEGRSIKLMPPKDNNALSNTFQIHIQLYPHDVVDPCIDNIAKERNLAVKLRSGLLIIYRPYPHLNEP